MHKIELMIHRQKSILKIIDKGSTGCFLCVCTEASAGIFIQGANGKE